MNRFLCGVVLILATSTTFAQDLIPTLYNGPTTFSRYQEFALDITVRNAGIVAVSQSTAAVYLSADNVWQATDVAIGYVSVSSLAAGQSFTGQSIKIAVDASPGTYYLIVKVDYDNSRTETDETNNQLITANVVVTVPNVDFSFASLSLDKSSYGQNSPVKPTFQLRNTGSTNVGGFIDVKFLLSKDATPSSDDWQLLSTPSSLNLTGPDNISSDPWLSLTLPTTQNGAYYILAIADRDYWNAEHFLETNENNNVVASPINIVSSAADLAITYVYDASYNTSELRVQAYIANRGSTAVSGYTMVANLMPQGGPMPTSFMPAFINTFDIALQPDESKMIEFSVYTSGLSNGTYYAVIKINENFSVVESNYDNNTFVDNSHPIIIGPPPVPGVNINNVSVPLTVDDTDQQIGLALDLSNTGSTTNFTQRYSFVVKNAQNTTVLSQQANVAINFSPGQTATKTVALNLSAPLPVGTYQVAVSCAGACNTTPSVVNANFDVVPTQYTLTGTIQGEDGSPLTKGKLFLYKDNGAGTVKFVQKVDPYQASSVSFGLSSGKYTLYFIPDTLQHLGYVPTIYGKTVVLGESNFFTISANKNVVFEVVKVQPLNQGTGIISGSVVSGSGSRQGGDAPMGGQSVKSIPVLLISSSGSVVGLTHSNAVGEFQFKDLPRDAYTVMLAYELDDPLMMAPYAVDIADKNASLNFDLSSGMVVASQSQLFLPQAVTLSNFSPHRYGDPSIALDGKSDVELPVQYTSSDSRIAMVDNGKIVIVGVGTVTISALQPGNNFYSAAHADRVLTIEKGLQSVSLTAPAEKTFGDAVFDVEALSDAGLPIKLSTSDEAVATIHKNTVLITGAGSVELIAEQPGNDLFEQAEPVRVTLTVRKASQTISFDEIPDQDTDVSVLPLAANASSGLGIWFESNNETVAVVDGNTVRIVKAGTVTITAHQEGNQNYLPAADVARTFNVAAILGIENLSATARLYPNPTSDFVWVTLPGTSTVEISDLLGRIRNDIFLTGDRLDFSHAESGVYLVKVTLKNQSTVQRIIKR